MIEQTWLYLVAGLLLSSLLLLVWKKASGEKATDHNLSQKERMFTSILEKAVGDGYDIHCKVPMYKVFQSSSGTSERKKKKAIKPLLDLQFDYIVCDSVTNKIVCAVELDDHDYDHKRHKNQDLFIEDLCYETALPLLRVAPQNGYNLMQIIERFEQTISTETQDSLPLSDNKFNLLLESSFSPESSQIA